MSQENVEIVRRHLEDWRRDDFDAFVSKVHSDIEWHAVLQRLVEGPESVYRGREGIRRLWHTYRTELDGFGRDLFLVHPDERPEDVHRRGTGNRRQVLESL